MGSHFVERIDAFWRALLSDKKSRSVLVILLATNLISVAILFAPMFGGSSQRNLQQPAQGYQPLISPPVGNAYENGLATPGYPSQAYPANTAEDGRQGYAPQNQQPSLPPTDYQPSNWRARSQPSSSGYQGLDQPRAQPLPANQFRSTNQFRSPIAAPLSQNRAGNGTPTGSAGEASDTASQLAEVLSRDVLITQARQLLRTKSTDMAIEVYKEIVKRDGQMPAGFLAYEMGVSFELAGDDELALRHYQMASDANDRDLRLAAMFGQARMLRNRGDLPAAMHLLAKLMLQTQNQAGYESGIAPELQYHWAELLVLAGGDPGERDTLDRNFATHPELELTADLLLSLGSRRDRPTASVSSVGSGKLETIGLQQSHPDLASVTVRYPQVSVADLLETTSKAMGYQLQMPNSLRADLQSQALAVDVEGMSISNLLRLLLEPANTGWSYDATTNTLSLRRYPTELQLKSPASAEGNRFADPSLPQDQSESNGITTPEQAQANQQLSAAKAAAEAAQALHRNRIAEMALRGALATTPNHPHAPYAFAMLGNLSFRRSDMDDAITKYKDVINRYRKHPSQQICSFNLAKCFLRLDQREKTKTQLYTVVDQRSGHEVEPAAYMLLGDLFLCDRSPKEAAREFSRGVTHSLDDRVKGLSVLSLAHAYLQHGNPRLALSTMMADGALLRTPTFQNSTAMLAAYANYQAAKTDSQKVRFGRSMTSALAFVKPKDFYGTTGYLLMSDIYAELGMAGKVASVRRAAVEAKIPQPLRDEFVFELGQFHLAERDEDDFVKAMQELKQRGVDRWPHQAQLRMAEYVMRQGELDECIRICRQLIKSAQTEDHKLHGLRVMGRAYERKQDHLSATMCYSGVMPPEKTQTRSNAKQSSKTAMQLNVAGG